MMADWRALWQSAVDFGPELRDLCIAYGLALSIGWNRERRGRSAGLRTFPLVALASAAFVQTGQATFVDSPEAMARIVEGIITGVGFIGGGAILKGRDQVHGTATAASVWATGAIGISVALGSYHVAVAVCLFATATLYLMDRLKPDAEAPRKDSSA